MAEQRDLPGWPKKRLVREVRSHLWRHGIRLQRTPWLAAWSWAKAVANSYFYPHWPTSSEIGTQYLLLLLAEMKRNHALRLPFRANKVIPEQVRAMFPGNPVPLLIHEPVTTARKPAGTEAGE